jgi:hypothetical protein
MIPNVLVFDIETAPILAYVWGLHDQNVSLNQIHSDWHVIAWSAKWLGKPANSVVYRDQRHCPDLSNDKGILRELWGLLDKADIVITQNGKSFDSKKLNARFIYHGMKPPSPYKHLDTYLIVRSVADFTSNKLEYLTNKLCKRYKKLSHSKFPGMELWKECLKGNMKAWEAMKKYNIHDVLSTEEFYEKIKAWAPQTAPAVYTGHLECRRCGKKSLEGRGWGSTNQFKYRKYNCKDCGAWSQGPKEKI